MRLREPDAHDGEPLTKTRTFEPAASAVSIALSYLAIVFWSYWPFEVGSASFQRNSSRTQRAPVSVMAAPVGANSFVAMPHVRSTESAFSAPCASAGRDRRQIVVSARAVRRRRTRSGRERGRMLCLIGPAALGDKTSPGPPAGVLGG